MSLHVLLEPVAALFFQPAPDRKSTRLNSSHSQISYAVFCLKKKINQTRSAHSPSAITPKRLSSSSVVPPKRRMPSPRKETPTGILTYREHAYRSFSFLVHTRASR